MLQELLESDRRPAEAHLREELRDRVGKRQLPLLREPEDERGSELLGHRPDLEHLLRRHRNPEIHLRHPVPFAHERLALPPHQHRRAGGVGGIGRSEEALRGGDRFG